MRAAVALIIASALLLSDPVPDRHAALTNATQGAEGGAVRAPASLANATQGAEGGAVQPHAALATNATQGGGGGRGGRCGIVWHYHVPKCAGTSFLGYLRSKESKGEFPGGLIKLFSMSQVIDFEAQVAPRLEQWIAHGQGLLAVHHHHRGPGLHALKPRLERYRARLRARGCDLFLTALLRDPYERAQSALAFTMPAHLVSAAASQRTAYWNSKLAVPGGAKQYDNQMVRYVLNNKASIPAAVEIPLGGVADEHVAEAAAILRTFAVVGFTDGYDAFVRRVAAAAGLRAQPPLPRENVTPHDRKVDALSIPASTRRLLAARTAQDDALVARVRGG